MRPMQHISYIYIYQNAPLIRIGWISIKKKKKKKKTEGQSCHLPQQYRNLSFCFIFWEIISFDL
jgi:hypothetical protein